MAGDMDPPPSPHIEDNPIGIAPEALQEGFNPQSAVPGNMEPSSHSPPVDDYPLRTNPDIPQDVSNPQGTVTGNMEPLPRPPHDVNDLTASIDHPHLSGSYNPHLHLELTPRGTQTRLYNDPSNYLPMNNTFQSPYIGPSQPVGILRRPQDVNSN